jgi:hypothetical protein
MEFYKTKQLNQQNAQHMNDQMRQQRTQPLNKFNKEVAADLGSDAALFTEELDDAKDINADLA